MRGNRTGTVAGLLLGAAIAATCMSGCDDKATPDTHAKVTIAGRTFTLEIASDDQTRFKGLSGRTKIDADGGMLFVFKKPSDMEFVMRDCPIPIDIIFVDGSGRVTAFHKMTPEPPRTEAEKQLSPPFKDAPQWTWTNAAYEARLKRYPSKFAAQYVIELAGNTLDTLKLKQNDQVVFDRAAMKKLAK
ncbi:MAG: hypothetical protein RL689_1628 [Planctomycetota bacterium]|jgi:uncharacterized membrane protein (UPF0127 family)